MRKRPAQCSPWTRLSDPFTRALGRPTTIPLSYRLACQLCRHKVHLHRGQLIVQVVQQPVDNTIYRSCAG